MVYATECAGLSVTHMAVSHVFNVSRHIDAIGFFLMNKDVYNVNFVCAVTFRQAHCYSSNKISGANS